MKVYLVYCESLLSEGFETNVVEVCKDLESADACIRCYWHDHLIDMDKGDFPYFEEYEEDTDYYDNGEIKYLKITSKSNPDFYIEYHIEERDAV